MSGIVDWLKSISESIVQIPLTIWNYVKDIPAQVWNFVKEIPGQVWNFFEGAFSSLGSVVSNIWDSVKGIPGSILDGLKWLFVPDTEHINNSIDSLVISFKNAFGVDSFDISGVFGTEAEIGNQQGTIQVGSITFTGIVFDSSFLLKAVNTFRPAIRGFIIFLLVLYNINQFMRFIGQEGISLGTLISSSRKEE